MIEPKDIEDLRKNKIVKMFFKLNERLIDDIVRQINKSGYINSATKGQIRQLILTTGDKLYLDALIKSKKLSKRQQKELDIIINEIKQTELHYYTKNDKFKINENPINKVVTHLGRIANKDFANIINSVAFATKKAYIDAMDTIVLDVLSGGFDFDTARKKTINALRSKGIQLKSKGKNYRLENMVKQSVLNVAREVANNISKEVGEQIGANCVVIGGSSTCRPSHYPINDVVLSLDEFKKYEHLTHEYNCNHVVNYDWREEFENKNIKVIYGEEHLTKKEIEKNYNIRQKQNYYARQVRYKKEEYILTDGDATSKLKLNLAQAKYRAFCKSKGLEVDYSKTWTSGYNK